MTELPQTVRPIFLAAGWYPGRRADMLAMVPSNHPASAILIEFGDLIVGDLGAGQECGKANVAFKCFEPDSLISIWADLLGERLIGIAEIDNGHAELYVDGSGRYYVASYMHDAFSFAGASFAESMERLLLGRRTQPMLRPDQANVVWYGEVFTTDDPRVYKYR
jgi:SUKH-3 immunity protein